MRRDPFAARQALLQMFRNPPDLTFEGFRDQRLACEEPRLHRPVELQEPDRTERFSSLKEVRKLLAHGVSKLEYGKTSREEWERHFRFADEEIRRTGHGRLEVRLRPVPKPPERPAVNDDEDDVGPADPNYVNTTRERAQQWFMEDLLPGLEPGAAVHLLGEPGAGKSTLLKYLININGPALAAEGVVFSRFEFLKFAKRWADEDKRIERALEEYISFILLRDIIRTQAYVHLEDCSLSRITIGPFAPAQLRNTIESAIGRSGTLDPASDRLIDSVEQVIRASCDKTKLRVRLLRQVPHQVRALLVSHFADRLRLVLVMDGLDCVSLEDVTLNGRRSKMMGLINKRSAKLTTFTILEGSGSFDVEVPCATIFVMRENTFYFYRHENLDIRRGLANRFYVKEIDTQLAMYNAIVRAVDLWATENGADEAERDRQKLMLWKVTRIAMRAISRSLRLRSSDGTLVDLFGGNIRTAFAFLERLLHWFLEDAVRFELLRANRDVPLREVVALMAGDEGYHLIRRRRYRIMEVLLFGRERWFENAVILNTGQRRFGELPGPEAGPSLKDNGKFSGFVDNIFNYHVARHAGFPNDHRLLEKLRILQLLDGLYLTETEAQERLEDRLGFESHSIEDTLTVLARAQMIEVHVGRDNQPRFTTSKRGRIIALHLFKSMSYLEHTFHRTRFPRQLIGSVHDFVRSRGVERWAYLSIRNAFIYLTYIKYLENHPECRKRTPGDMRITSDLQESLIETLDRILASNKASWRPGRARDERSEARWRLLAIRAERLIENLVSDWTRQGLIAAPATFREPVLQP